MFSLASVVCKSPMGESILSFADWLKSIETNFPQCSSGLCQNLRMQLLAKSEIFALSSIAYNYRRTGTEAIASVDPNGSILTNTAVRML